MTTSLSDLATLAIAVAAAGLGGAAIFFLRRASRGRRELAARLHDAALALDRRCDALQEQIRTLDRRQRVDHVCDLVARGETEGRLAPEVARRLTRYASELRAETAVRHS